MKHAVAVAFVICCCALAALSQEKHVAFDDFVKQYGATILRAERDSSLEHFWRTARARGIPYLDANKREATFLYRGNDSVRVLGDFTSWAFRMPMKRLPESNLWYLKLAFEPDARLDYKLVINSDRIVLDPQNSRTVPHRDGVRSELAMPEFSAAIELEEKSGTPKGTLATLNVESKSLGYDHKVLVYLPDGYERSTANLPVAYFQDGGEYVDFAQATIVLDNLIAAEAIEPVIGVFVVPPSDAKRTRTTEYSFNKKYETFFTTELIPFIDKKYRTEKFAQRRLVVGSSLGGVMSLAIAFNNHEVVGNVASQSGFVTLKNDTMVALFSQGPPKPLRISLGVGTYEKNVGGAIPVARDADLLSAHRRLRGILEQRQYQLRYREFRDGHSWGRWRTELPNILRWFFPKEN